MQLTTPSDALQAVAHFIKTARLNANITLEELALRSGVGTATLSRVEKRGVCSTDTLVRVFAALGMLDHLLAAFIPEEGQTIAELRKLHAPKPRQRARKKG
jgi:transcriptional regulator with XRE-family HTH domain